MALYSIKFRDRNGRLVYEHIETFPNDDFAKHCAEQEAHALDGVAPVCEIWNGERCVATLTHAHAA